MIAIKPNHAAATSAGRDQCVLFRRELTRGWCAPNASAGHQDKPPAEIPVARVGRVIRRPQWTGPQRGGAFHAAGGPDFGNRPSPICVRQRSTVHATA
jgi:hypothetical protein